MTLPTSLNIPPWNNRRWLLFKDYISQSSVIETVARYQRENYINSGTYPLWAYGDIVINYLPDGCSEAYIALLNTPGITDQELLDLIKPPIEIISHVDKHVGLNNDPSQAYENYMHRIGADDHQDEVDQLFEDDTSLYLRIAPRTIQTEITAFVSEYFKEEMRPHLQKQPIWDTKQSPYMDKLNSKTRKSVGDRETIKQRILSLKAEGRKAPEITDIIDEEFKKYYEPQNIRKIISEAKKNQKM